MVYMFIVYIYTRVFFFQGGVVFFLLGYSQFVRENNFKSVGIQCIAICFIILVILYIKILSD